MIIGAALWMAEIAGVPQSRIADFDYRSKVVTDLPPTNSSIVAEARRAEFERRYQTLVKAMNAFAERYNSSNGNIWPHKEATAVRKAFGALERLEASFETARK